jgi:hypothetical protein
MKPVKQAYFKLEDGEACYVPPWGVFPVRAERWTADTLSSGLLETIEFTFVDVETKTGKALLVLIASPGKSESATLMTGVSVSDLVGVFLADGTLVEGSRKSVGVGGLKA